MESDVPEAASDVETSAAVENSALDTTLPPPGFEIESPAASAGSAIEHAAGTESSLISAVRPQFLELLTPPVAPAVTELSLVSTLTGEAETVRIDSSLVLIGRSSQCDLRLMHADVSRRHACLHVLRDRVLCVDLGSRTGVHWEGKRRQAGWLDASRPVVIGPFELRLVTPGAQPDTVLEVPEAESLFSRQQTADPCRPGFGLRFLNRKNAGTREIALARPITLIGRDQHCKLRLKDDSVSRVHSSLMLTADGVWVMDLLGRGGVKVNGELVSSARLAPGDELQIGLYRMQFVNDFPTESGSTETLPACQSSEEFPIAPALDAAISAPPPFTAQGMVSESLLLAMTETFADMQRQMHEQFRLQMDFMAGIVESVRRESNNEIHAELARLAAITEEIREAQRSLSRAALAAPEPTTSPDAAIETPHLEKVDPGDGAASPTADAPRIAVPADASEETLVDEQPDHTSEPDSAESAGLPPRQRPAVAMHDRDALADHALLTRRLRELERERNSCWSKLARMLKRDG